MKYRYWLVSFLGWGTACWPLGICSADDLKRQIVIRNPYNGMAGDDAAQHLQQFAVFPKGGKENTYKIGDWHVKFDFELTQAHTLNWKYNDPNVQATRRYILYPAWWNPVDQGHHPQLLCMLKHPVYGDRLLNKVRDEIKEVTLEDYWRTDIEHFRIYYELVKRFHGGDKFPFERIDELKKIEETARLRGLGLIKKDLRKDQRYKVVTTIQSWNGWALVAVVEDEGAGDVTDYRPNDPAKDEVIRNWLLGVLQVRFDSAQFIYAKNWKEYFPDRPVKELCDEFPGISELLMFDAQFFYKYVYDEPWKGIVQRAIDCRQEPVKAICNQLLFGTEFVTATNPITGKETNLFPVFGNKEPTPGREIHEEMRLAALELAVSILLRKD